MARTGQTSKGTLASRQIDSMIKVTAGWRGAMLSKLRAEIRTAVPTLVEEVKWRKPSNPAGVPVWSLDGIVCVGNILKNAVRLTFPHGAEIRDPTRLFNARLDSASARAIDFHEGEKVDRGALQTIVREAVRLNVARGHAPPTGRPRKEAIG